MKRADVHARKLRASLNVIKAEVWAGGVGERERS
jgi:hypothetical protein